jgi:hypothetical protein
MTGDVFIDSFEVDRDDDFDELFSTQWPFCLIQRGGRSVMTLNAAIVVSGKLQQ